MNASSLSGECARRISVVFCTAAGVDMLGPSWLLREIVTHPGPLERRREDDDAPVVLLVAVKKTKVCASSGQSAESANQEYHTPWPKVQTTRGSPREATNCSPCPDRRAPQVRLSFPAKCRLQMRLSEA